MPMIRRPFISPRLPLRVCAQRQTAATGEAAIMRRHSSRGAGAARGAARHRQSSAAKQRDGVMSRQRAAASYAQSNGTQMLYDTRAQSRYYAVMSHDGGGTAMSAQVMSTHAPRRRCHARRRFAANDNVLYAAIRYAPLPPSMRTTRRHFSFAALSRRNIAARPRRRVTSMPPPPENACAPHTPVR